MENFLNPTAGESDIGSNECIEQYFLLYIYVPGVRFLLTLVPSIVMIWLKKPV
jgi:hypothetical protein